MVAAGSRKGADRDSLFGVWLDDRFLIEQRIATGGFGAVYRGRARDGTQVALKILHGWLTNDDRIVARFRREGATLTQLHSPHTVRTLALGETDGLLYIAMELLSGESLHDRMRRLPAIPWQEAVEIARAVCSSLAEAHALGVIHRDLKPANIHLAGPSGAHTVKVIDFGIAKIARGSAVDDGRELTRAGHMVGTCDYMSPEQLMTNDCRAPSDIYALGLVMYEMLTGQRAFPQATGPASMLATLLTQTAAPPSIHAAIPAALDHIVMRCIDRDVDARYPEVGELIAALDEVLAARHTREEITVVAPTIALATWVDDPSAWPADARDDINDVTPVCDVSPELTDTGATDAAPERATEDRTDRTQLAAPGDSSTALFTTLPGVTAPRRAPRRARPFGVPPMPPTGSGHAQPGSHRVADPDAAFTEVAWIPPLMKPGTMPGQASGQGLAAGTVAEPVDPAAPIAPMARGSSSDLHAAATVARPRSWAFVGWLAVVVAIVLLIAYAALMR